MDESLEQLLLRLSKDQSLFDGIEEATKQAAVLPILSKIGWNFFNLREVFPEFPVGSGRVDYCLLIGQKRAAFIEVKRASEDLYRHEKQLLEYAFTYGVEIAVLTNGFVWSFYLPLVEGDWQQRKVFTIDIQKQQPRDAAKHFREFLSRDNVIDGSAVANAKELKESREKDELIKKTIPKAWLDLIGEPDELLIELFADKVESTCGYRPEFEQLSDFLGEQRSPKELLKSQKTIITKASSAYKPVVPKTPKQKGAVIAIEGEDIIATSVSDLYRQALKILLQDKLIDQVKARVPYATSKKRLLISTEPIHQGGNEFRSPVEYKGYYMEAHKSYKIAIDQLKSFLKVCKISLQSIE